MIRAWAPVFLWMLAIFLGSTDLLSSQRTSRFIGPFLRWLKPDVSATTIEAVQFAVRKAGHMTEYAILAILLLRALHVGWGRRDGWDGRKAAAACLLASLYAVTDEFHQWFVATRYASGLDVLIDTLGAVFGITLTWLWSAFRRKPLTADCRL